MPVATTRFAIVRYDNGQQQLHISFLDLQDQRSYGPAPHAIALNDMKEATGAFWAYVNRKLPSLPLDGDDEAVGLFFDDFLVYSSQLCNKLLPAEMQAALWSAAEEAEELVLVTDLFQIPWEALYAGDSETGSFLSEKCTVLRIPHDPGGAHRPLQREEPVFERRRAIFLDPHINEALRVLPNGKCIRMDGGLADESCSEKQIKRMYDLLRDEYGGEVFLTRRKPEFSESVKRTKAVHWLCHHAQSGLRLTDGVYYGRGDAGLYKFARGGVLFLTSCKAGVDELGEISLAAEIYLRSHCSVVAPSSLIEASAGFSFLRRVNKLVDAAPGPLSLSAFWRSVRGPGWKSSPSVVSCMSLLFGIYGSGKTLIKEA